MQNAVEEYVYEIRGKIHDELEKFISDADRDKLSLQLEDTENWLYEEGEDCKKQIYLDKLAELKVRVTLCKDIVGNTHSAVHYLWTLYPHSRCSIWITIVSPFPIEYISAPDFACNRYHEKFHATLFRKKM